MYTRSCWKESQWNTTKTFIFGKFFKKQGSGWEGKLIFLKLTTKTVLTTQALEEDVVVIGMEAPENADMQMFPPHPRLLQVALVAGCITDLWYLNLHQLQDDIQTNNTFCKTFYIA
jgi:hypothetical protein